jgi:hypothetical protein
VSVPRCEESSRAALEGLRQAAPLCPGTLPVTGFGFPNRRTPAARTNGRERPRILAPYMRQMPAPGLDQARVIEQVKAMMASPDPAVRAQAGAFMRQHGRSFLGTAAHKATGGLTDWLMTQDADTAARGYPLQFLDRYTPEQMAFGNRLSREVTPGEYHGAEIAGTAAKIGVGARPAGWLLRLLRAGAAPRGPAPAGL